MSKQRSTVCLQQQSDMDRIEMPFLLAKLLYLEIILVA